MSFEKSIGAILHHEGGYCNHKEDAGGETYKGIARRSWPNWQGWETIDSAKTQLNPGSTRKSWATFTGFIETNYPHIQAAVEAFYRVTFWETVKCDYFSDAVGHLLFDFSVNSGNSRATKHLQKALLALGAKIEVDGKLGEQTINETGMYEPAIVSEVMLQDREAFYRAIVEKKPDQGKFLSGWLARVEGNRTFITENYLT